MAKRVIESIMHSTFLPWSRKCSAIASVMYAAWRRISADSSPVATMMMLRLRPSGPK